MKKWNFPSPRTPRATIGKSLGSRVGLGHLKTQGKALARGFVHGLFASRVEEHFDRFLHIVGLCTNAIRHFVRHVIPLRNPVLDWLKVINWKSYKQNTQNAFLRCLGKVYIGVSLSLDRLPKKNRIFDFARNCVNRQSVLMMACACLWPGKC